MKRSLSKKMPFLLLAILMFAALLWIKPDNVLITTLVLATCATLTSVSFISNKDNIWLKCLTWAALLGAIVLLPYILGQRAFLFCNDQNLQYDYFYKEWDRMIDLFLQNRQLPFYSFNDFLGNNYFASKLYYLTGDVFFPVVHLFKNISHGLLFETYTLILVSSLSFLLFLKLFGIKNQKVMVCMSLIYAISGTASQFTGQYMFHRFYAFLPLLLAGIELYREKGKLVLFSLSVVLCFLSNYYFMFPTSIFMIIYYIKALICTRAVELLLRV